MNDKTYEKLCQVMLPIIDKRFLEWIRQKAKKEVSDDINKLIENAKKDINITVLDREFILDLLQKIQSKLKQRHLSTLPKAKRHNNNFKKDFKLIKKCMEFKGLSCDNTNCKSMCPLNPS